jgi:hypothetical protein
MSRSPNGIVSTREEHSSFPKGAPFAMQHRAMSPPLLVAELPGVGGRIRARLEAGLRKWCVLTEMMAGDDQPRSPVLMQRFGR